MPQFIPLAMGWLPDIPDPRDYSAEHQEVRSRLGQLRYQASIRDSPPISVDLRLNDEGDLRHFGSVPDQATSNNSTAHAVLGLVEYFERRSHGHTFEGSTEFLHEITRNFQPPGESGVGLRAALKALHRFGVPPADLWQQQLTQLETELKGVLFAGYAREFADLSYFRVNVIDRKMSPLGTSEKPRDARDDEQLTVIRSFLAAGFPVAFGFPVPRSMTSNSDIPYRPLFDSIRGGQAVVAVGYDDHHQGASRSGGALLIRSSWGDKWGDDGYGWLPYAYVINGHTADFWTIMRPDWLASGEYFLPSVLMPH